MICLGCWVFQDLLTFYAQGECLTHPCWLVPATALARSCQGRRLGSSQASGWWEAWIWSIAERSPDTDAVQGPLRVSPRWILARVRSRVPTVACRLRMLQFGPGEAKRLTWVTSREGEESGFEPRQSGSSIHTHSHPTVLSCVQPQARV